MKPNEHILTYISRVKDLRSAVIDCDRDADIDNINNLTRRSFIRGIKPELRTEVRHMRTEPLDYVYDGAIAFYKEFEQDKARFGSKQVRFSGREMLTSNRDVYFSRRSPSPYRSNDDLSGSTPAQQYDARRFESPRNDSGYGYRAPMYTNRSRDDGAREPQRVNSYRHAVQSSNSNNNRPRSSRETYTPPQRRDDNRAEARAPAKICNYCKTPGHDIHECRKRKYNNKLRKQSGNGSALPLRGYLKDIWQSDPEGRKHDRK